VPSPPLPFPLRERCTTSGLFVKIFPFLPYRSSSFFFSSPYRRRTEGKVLFLSSSFPLSNVSKYVPSTPVPARLQDFLLNPFPPFVLGILHNPFSFLGSADVEHLLIYSQLHRLFCFWARRPFPLFPFSSRVSQVDSSPLVEQEAADNPPIQDADATGPKVRTVFFPSFSPCLFEK